MKQIITVTNLSKIYTIHHEKKRYKSLRDDITQLVKHPFSALQSNKNEKFHALKNISFSIDEGETVGIIGANGAGKSTILKILSRITPPTKGEIRLRGRVSSLLEVGTGFHPELTGRENIFLNGSVLGMKHREIRNKFDAIVDFAEIEQFLDTPVKHYSSGMYMRLAFSVAAHLEPEILIVDEVLAVGDAQFQKKCLGKMKDVGKEGRTVIFVSHNMGAISSLCKKSLLLEKGELVEFDESSKVIKKYFADSLEKTGDIVLTDKNTHSGFTFTHINVLNKKGEQSLTIDFGEPFTLQLKALYREKISKLVISITILSVLGHPLYNSQITNKELSLENYTGSVQFTLDLDPNIFGSGTYTVSLGAQWKGMSLGMNNTVTFTITDTNADLPRYIPYDGYTVYPRKWAVEKLSSL